MITYDNCTENFENITTIFGIAKFIYKKKTPNLWDYLQLNNKQLGCQ